MLQNLLTVAGFILAGILVYRYQHRILNVLRRFDARNVQRIEDEIRDRSDNLAHFRHTLKLAEEQVEEVQEIVMSDARTARPVTRYVFEGEFFASRRDAEHVRAARVRDKARAFYLELPAALASRGNGKLRDN